MAKKDSSKGLNRENLHYVGIPVELWEQLSALAEEEDRSVAWMTRQAVKEFLERHASPAGTPAAEKQASKAKEGGKAKGRPATEE